MRTDQIVVISIWQSWKTLRTRVKAVSLVTEEIFVILACDSCAKGLNWTKVATDMFWRTATLRAPFGVNRFKLLLSILRSTTLPLSICHDERQTTFEASLSLRSSRVILLCLSLLKFAVRLRQAASLPLQLWVSQEPVSAVEPTGRDGPPATTYLSPRAQTGFATDSQPSVYFR